MLAQADTARAAEKAVIADYNSQLATKAAAFASSHSGVSKTPAIRLLFLINSIGHGPDL